MVDLYTVVRRLTGHELISPKDARLLTEAVDGLIDEIGSKDARIAELEAEVERLRNMLNGYGKLDAELAIAERRIEDLSRTGAVKVLPRPDAVSMTCGTICLEYEDRDRRDAAYDWLENHAYAPLSALEPSAPEGQQEPVAWMDATGTELHKIIQDYQKRDMIASGGRQAERAPNYSIALFTRPSEQAVTEAMVARASAEYQEIFGRYLLSSHARRILKAAMEAGR